MKKVNFGISIDGIDGKPLGDLKEVFGNVLLNSTEGNPIKMKTWAFDMYKNGFVEMDEADLEWLITFTTNDKRIPNITKAAALEVMQEAKTEVK